MCCKPQLPFEKKASIAGKEQVAHAPGGPEAWCVDPVHCQIVSLLEFLQSKLSLGLRSNTLRTYVATFSDCHALIDGVSVGRHLLVARYNRGAKRLRPPTSVTVPRGICL